jgi:hypothetical protein
MRHRPRTHWLLCLTLSLFQLTGCAKRVPFNSRLEGRFFPLDNGMSWRYRVTYSNGASETITDRILKSDQIGSLRSSALMLSDYSGVDGSRAVRPDVPKPYPTVTTQVEIRYIVERGFLTRVTNLGGTFGVQVVEDSFLPRYLGPDRIWSSSTHFDILKMYENHRSFFENDEVVSPAGSFSQCIRVETETSYDGPPGTGSHADIRDKRYFIDWYAPDVGLVKTLVLVGGQNGREIARVELLRFAKIGATAALAVPTAGQE